MVLGVLRGWWSFFSFLLFFSLFDDWERGALRGGRGGLTVDVPRGVERLGVVWVVGCSGRRTRPVGSGGVDPGAVGSPGDVARLQLEEAGGEGFAAFALPRGGGGCPRGAPLAEEGGVVGAGRDVVGEWVAGRLRGVSAC